MFFRFETCRCYLFILFLSFNYGYNFIQPKIKIALIMHVLEYIPQNLSNYLSNGLIGIMSTQNAHHAILHPGMLGIVLYKSQLVVV